MTDIQNDLRPKKENSTRNRRQKITSVQSDRLLKMLVLKDGRQNLSDLTAEFNMHGTHGH